MSIHRNFLDEQFGDSELFGPGQRLPSAVINSLLTFSRQVESAAYESIVGSWSKVATAVAAAPPIMAYDDALGMWIAASGSGFTPTMSTSIGGIEWTSRTITSSNFSPSCAVSNDAGTFVVGGSVSSASTSKLVSSTDGSTWTFRSTSTSDTKGVTALAWDSVNSLFVAAISAGGLETSPNGVTWTARAVPVALAAERFTSAAHNGLSPNSLQPSLGSLTVVSGFNSSNYMSSPDSVTWTARSFPASDTYSVVYVAGLGLWFAIGRTHAYSNTDGGQLAGWVPITLPPGIAGGSSGIRAMAFGDLLVCAYTLPGSEPTIAISRDEGTTWKKVLTLPSYDPTAPPSAAQSRTRIAFSASSSGGSMDVFFSNSF